LSTLGFSALGAGLALVFPDGDGRAGRLVLGGLTFRCALGKGGVRPAEAKCEGDGATPAARMALRRVLYRADRGPVPQAIVPVEPLAPQDGWCDASGHRSYNRAVTLPFDASHEALWRDDLVYDVIGVLGWNDAPVERGRGSAIFLHLARPDLAPTEGCIALPGPDLRRLLAAGLTAIEVRLP
jgi:L,D-peptidoglycan transpeptidase YkuD (ErfK/YbiS/YcfS/YnhG family)